MNKLTVKIIKNDEQPLKFFVFTQFEKNNELIVFFPFYKADKYLEFLKNNKINVQIDKKIEPSSLKKIKLMLNEFFYNQLIKGYNPESLLIKITASLILGIVIFLMLVFLVPDPIPVLDELGISFFISLVFYFIINRLKTFSFVPSKKMDTYLGLIDKIQVFQSNILENINIIFEKNYQKILNIINKSRDLDNIKDDTEINMILEKYIHTLDGTEFLELKEIIEIVNKNFNFRKLLNLQVKFEKIYEKSGLSRERLYYLYLLYKKLN